MTTTNIIVYAGRGASHSWTWLADLFESKGIFNVRFLDSAEFVRALDGHPTIALVSGGDGFTIASSLLGEGFTRLEEFVDSADFNSASEIRAPELVFGILEALR